MPTMAVDPRVEPPFHLSPISGFRPFSSVATPIQMDHGTTNTPLFAGKTMVVFAVVPRVPQQTIDGEMATRLANRLGKLRPILTRAITDHGAGKPVSRRVTNHGQFWPAAAQESFVSDTTDVVPGGVSRFQAGGVDGRFRLVIDQAARLGKAENRSQEPVKRPFFKSRSWAYLSVESCGIFVSSSTLHRSGRSCKSCTRPR